MSKRLNMKIDAVTPPVTPPTTPPTTRAAPVWGAGSSVAQKSATPAPWPELVPQDAPEPAKAAKKEAPGKPSSPAPALAPGANPQPAAVKLPEEPEGPKITFDDMNLPENLLRGIYGMGFTEPTPVQAKSVIPAATGRDLIIQAQSGTGKTAAFSICMLQQLDPRLKAVQGLVLSPTRELAIQTANVTELISSYMSIQVQACTGGVTVAEERKGLLGGTQVVSGTPGRILDHLERKNLSPGQVRVLVLDEADKLLEDGLQEQVSEIIRARPKEVQILVVSATLEDEPLEVTKKFLRDPIRMLVDREKLTLEGISQFYVSCRETADKVSIIVDLFSQISLQQTVMFCNSQRRVDEIGHLLRENDFSIIEIHAGLSHKERETALTRFRLGDARVLLGTDIIARGIDVQQVSVVINIDLPLKDEDYLHRIGRGGRRGRKAVALNLITPREEGHLAHLQSYYKTIIGELRVDSFERAFKKM
jgi:translation initiation factor 4A